jgi:Protein of unknown function (DUF775)
MDVDFDAFSASLTSGSQFQLTPNLAAPVVNTPLSPSNINTVSHFGLIVPGGIVRTDFVPVDATQTKFSLSLHTHAAAGGIAGAPLSSPITSIHEIVFFLLPTSSLPGNFGVLLYWQVQVLTTTGQVVGGTEYELLGSVTPGTCPSAIFLTGWGEHEQIADLVTKFDNITTFGVINFGVSVEPIGTVENLVAASSQVRSPTSAPTVRLAVAEKIALDLFNFMRSFDTPNGTGNMVVPISIFDRWITRFRNRFQRDPNFFLKSSD